uniref:Uncharacterized protein n=1 Tax=Tanacetum cinerariifolium TaxID=118510 RepID=A0A699H4F4_TANCI|nr:hypothetical protein [Tanacetum cinerariifolium]
MLLYLGNKGIDVYVDLTRSSPLTELEKDAVTLLKQIIKVSVAQTFECWSIRMRGSYTSCNKSFDYGSKGWGSLHSLSLLGLDNVLISCLLMLFSFGVDIVEDFKEYTQRDYYCWLKTYNCWYKLKLLDNAAGRKLRLLEESVVADEKMKR